MATDILTGIASATIAAGLLTMLVRQVLLRSIAHMFDRYKSEFDADLKQTLETHSVELQLWSAQQRELFKSLLESRAATMNRLLQLASQLRRLVLRIGKRRDLAQIELMYKRYCDLFYSDPVLPRGVFDAAHRFRSVAEEAVGACRAAGSKEEIVRPIVHKLNDSYDALLEEVRDVLLPGEPSGEGSRAVIR